MLECNDQDFRMVIDRRENDDKALVVLLEFGTGIVSRLIAKSRVMRDMMDPEATLIVMSSSINGQKNMNFSKKERSLLKDDKLDPYVQRLITTMESKYVESPSDVTVFGPSQGATLGLAYAGNRDVDPIKLAMFKPPNVVERNNFEMVKSFINAGGNLSEVIAANFTDSDET